MSYPAEKDVYGDEKGAETHVKDVTVSSAEEADEYLANTNVGDHGTKRDLTPRVVSMIAIAGTIGTGLFLGSGAALTLGGPVGFFIAYVLIGISVGMMMMAMGEMTVYRPNVGGFIEMGTKYVDPAFGFMMGINYSLQGGFGIPTELAAVAELFTFWDGNKSHSAAYITAFLILVLIVNIVGVKYYGEVEFFFACVKVATLVGLIIFGLIADLGGMPPKKEFIGGRYWRDEPFNDNHYRGLKPVSLSRFLGFWGVFTKAAFAYSNVESVAIIAGEAHNPRKTMKMAVKTVFYRIVGIYVISVLIIGLNVSQYSPDLLAAEANGSGTAAASPFVIICKQAGVKVLPHIINAVVITSAMSSGNEQTYAFSRTIMAMARNGCMPKFFLKTSKAGIPYGGVGVATAFSCLAYLSVSNGSNQAFQWLSNLSALSSLITWIGICACFVRFQKAMRVQGIDRRKLPFRGYFQPGMAYICIFFYTVILIFNGFGAFIGGFDVSGFFACYITLPVVGIAWVGWKIYRPCKWVPLDEIDLSGGPADVLKGTRYDTSGGNDFVAYA